MNIDVKVNIDTAAILKKMGLGESREAQVYLANTVESLSRPYVPKSAGSGAHMVQQAKVADDGSKIVYDAPYAHYQYVGEVRDGRAPKQRTGREIQYHDGPMRGKEWDKRMMADRGDEVERGLAEHIKERLR